VDEVLGPEELPYLLAESDYVVVALPLTEETRTLIGEAELRAMKPSAVIVNIGRGAIIDEAEWHFANNTDARIELVEKLAALSNHFERAARSSI